MEKLPAWSRFTLALTARAVLQPLASSPAGSQQLALLCHAILLPMLDGVGAGKRLSLVTEGAGALKSLLCDSPDNQRAAVEDGGVPVLVQLLYAHNLNIAGSAAEAISFLMGQFRWAAAAAAGRGARACLPACLPAWRGSLGAGACWHLTVQHTPPRPACCRRRLRAACAGCTPASSKPAPPSPAQVRARHQRRGGGPG
jgi:hypothetical protein